jgi:pimeloyl-ACP methyl ester carboxylesterase
MSTGSVTTNDGVELRYLESGSGPPLVLVHGWRQSAAGFGRQIEELGRSRRVIALDMRGHGESAKPAHGFRIARLAMDLRNLIDALELRDIALLGHSLGCAVVWCYWDLFGGDRVSKLVLVDMAADAVLPPRQLLDEIDRLDSFGSGRELVTAIRDAWFTPGVPDADLAVFGEQADRVSREHARALLLDSAFVDWSDVLRLIDVPALVVGGAALAEPVSRVASLIPGARLELFPVDEGGGHFMFWENPERFNAVLERFLSAPS